MEHSFCRIENKAFVPHGREDIPLKHDTHLLPQYRREGAPPKTEQLHTNIGKIRKALGQTTN